jgi:hypothetical protein
MRTDPLPRPDVSVTPAGDRDPGAPQGSVDVVISRDGKAISHRAEGSTTSEVVKDAVEKILNDHRSAEWVK